MRRTRTLARVGVLALLAAPILLFAPMASRAAAAPGNQSALMSTHSQFVSGS